MHVLATRRTLCLRVAVVILSFASACWLTGRVVAAPGPGNPLTALDVPLAQWFHRHMTPALTTVMRTVTAFASAPWVAIVVTTAALVLLAKRAWPRLLLLLLAVPGGLAMLPLLKSAFHRSRPAFEGAFATVPGYSMPSGHTMAATLLYGMLAVLALDALSSRCSRALAMLGAASMVLLVGLSRLYLGAHYLSDVIAAALAGSAWLALSLAAMNSLQRRRLNRDLFLGAQSAAQTPRQPGPPTQ